MVVSGLLGVLREIYKLAWLDFASESDVHVAASGAFSSQFFSAFMKGIDSAGRKDPAKSVFNSDSGWALGGSAKVEKRIFEQLREHVLVAYEQMVTDDSSNYQGCCARFSGTRRSASLMKSLGGERRRELWKRTEDMWTTAAHPAVNQSATELSQTGDG